MVKAYVIEAHYDYEGFEIVGIFTSKHRAEQALVKISSVNKQPDKWKISEHNVNKYPEYWRMP